MPRLWPLFVDNAGRGRAEFQALRAGIVQCLLSHADKKVVTTGLA